MHEVRPEFVEEQTCDLDNLSGTVRLDFDRPLVLAHKQLELFKGLQVVARRQRHRLRIVLSAGHHPDDCRDEDVGGARMLRIGGDADEVRAN